MNKDNKGIPQSESCAPSPNKKTNWKGILAIILIMAIGYGAGFGTLALAHWLNERNGSHNVVEENTECNDEIQSDVNLPVEVKKPIIYFYPTTTTNINIKLGNPHLLTCSYPEYNDGWQITATPDGKIVHEDTELYALYYEADLNNRIYTKRTGFMVKRENTARFLEEKLTILGLNYKEKQEFIMYWLPILEQNKYNYIYFATDSEINAQMPLEIFPQPDTTIRVWMYYQGLDAPFEVTDQKLEAQNRSGFTVVEWGGAAIPRFRSRIMKTGPIIKIPPFQLH